LDEVIFLPAACSPFKQGHTTYFTDAERLHMLKLATAAHPWASVSELDLQLPPPSWSWRIAEYWHNQHPSHELYWLMGTDQWEQLHKWARFDYLCELLHFIVYHREQAPYPRTGIRSTFINAGMHPASSSAIRQALQNHTPIPSGWLPPEVESFVLPH
ncbi:MAG: nicotinate-nicotinamide nucleotide adenylyltransferase, partial [Akkermansia sp.]|nr:nicotinate-nicotinamide nucleotide adenylyltransferase [Akkermansia sp.]